MQVDFSHRAGVPTASEAHLVERHVATDMALERSAADKLGHWDVKGEVFNYLERMEWRNNMESLPARRHALTFQLINRALRHFPEKLCY